MATSELGHYVRFDPTLIDSSGADFVDAGMARRAVGNLDHIADQVAQSRVNVVFQTYRASENTAVDTDARVWTSTPFDMHVRADGTSYRARVRLDASSQHATHKATFTAVIAPEGASAAELAEDGPNVSACDAFADTGYVETSPNDLLYLDADRVARAARRVSTIDSIGGSSRTVPWLRVQLVIFGQVSDLAAEARVRGIHLHEYLPP